ncbi:hypothetical protein PMAYCL1PPCAC_22093, partial [Pristionchus mayeri]
PDLETYFLSSGLLTFTPQALKILTVPFLQLCLIVTMKSLACWSALGRVVDSLIFPVVSLVPYVMTVSLTVVPNFLATMATCAATRGAPPHFRSAFTPIDFGLLSTTAIMTDTVRRNGST